MRKWGFRSQKEAVERDLAYTVRDDLSVKTAKAKELSDKVIAARLKGNTKEAHRLEMLYGRMTGTMLKDDQVYQRVLSSRLTDMERTLMSKKNDPAAMMELAKMRKRMEQ